MTSHGALEIDIAQRVDGMLTVAMRRYDWPGLAIGIVCQGTVIYTRSFGVANVRSRVPLTTNTVLRMGSISKTLTAIGVMQLWERGLFHLDDPVNPYLKGYRVEHPDPATPPVTFRHLLTHTAGLGALRRYTDMLHPYTGQMILKQGRSLPAFPAYYGPVLKAERYPGTAFSYTNHGYATLGQLIADISGEPFAHYMRDHVFSPLGMAHTDFLRGTGVKGRLATAHKGRPGRRTPVTDPEIIPGPAGALFSTVEDMARYLVALLNGGATAQGRALRPETVRLMMTPWYRQDDRLPAMGLGFMLDSVGAYLSAGHTGAVPWYTASLHAVPDAGLGIVMAINTYDETLPAVTREVLCRLLDVPSPTPPAVHARIASCTDVWPELCGHYGPPRGLLSNLRFWGAWGGEIEVSARKGYLVMRPLMPLGPHGAGRRLYPAGTGDPLHCYYLELGRRAPALFRRSDGGQIDTLCLGLLYTLRRRRGMESLRLRLSTALAGIVGVITLTLVMRWRRPSRSLLQSRSQIGIRRRV